MTISKKKPASTEVKTFAVENFLMSLDGLSKMEAGMNLSQDARDYKWNAKTVAAIRKGIEQHYKNKR